MTDHSPTPWRIEGSYLVDASGKPVMGDAGEYDQMADMTQAPRILKAVNAHDDLVRLLNENIDNEPCWLDHHGYCQAHQLDDVNNGGCRVENARKFLAALARAQGENQ